MSLFSTGIRGEELLPGADVVSDEELEAWVVQNVDTGYHPVGTCRMSADPRDGVVDGISSISLRVKKMRFCNTRI